MIERTEQGPYEIEPERYEFEEPPRYRFSLSRRAFVQCVGAGLLITAFARPGSAQRGDAPSRSPGERFHIDKNGVVTVLTGKVEVGQGSRTQIAQAAAEELRVPLSQIRVVMADTSVVPNDGGTYGSQTTPRTVPAVRNAAAAARELLVELASDHWKVLPEQVSLQDGVLADRSGQKMTLAELVAKVADVDEALRGKSSDGAELTPPDSWRVLGKPTAHLSGRDVVTGKHRYASDIRPVGVLFGKVLRPPSYGAELVDIDTRAAEAMEGVIVLRDGAFVGCAAPSTHQARLALAALAASAKWDAKPHPSSSELFGYLKENTRAGSGRSRSREDATGDVDAALKSAGNVLRASYAIPYIQHAPMETRSAVAEWKDGRLTVWTGTQRPFDVRRELAAAFDLSEENVRLIVPDTGGGFGGKHQGDAAVEAARLAKAANRPVSIQWTREEEFTWAYFRPAGVIEIAAALDESGKIVAWDFTNYNSGGSGLDCPYVVANNRERFQPAESPLRQGSYRALAATANNFAREAFMDELAAAAGADPLVFRLAHLDEPRMKNVLNAAAEKFGFANLRQEKKAGVGHGIACGTEKGSFVATCAAVQMDPQGKGYKVPRVCVAFECGAIQNPANLRSQVEGCVMMGLGAALREAIHFDNGKVRNTNFKQYEVPRFEDLPELEVVLLNRPDLPSAGAGETPIIGIAPAIANALFHATGRPLRALPLSLAAATQA